jgi:hypothetical protein
MNSHQIERVAGRTTGTPPPIRRAFLGNSSDNYWMPDGRKYAAICVPYAKRGARRKRGVDSTDEILRQRDFTLEEFKEMEQESLRLLRAYNRREAGLEETLAAVLAYDRLFGKDRDHETWYRRVLADRPWQQCGCPICEAIGIEVVIFRGNNRNRRRGFHNVQVFYEQFRRAVAQASDQVPAQRASTTPE